MNATPIGLKKIDPDIEITWSDGQRRRYSPTQLRQACPCALCKEKAAARQQATASNLSLPVLGPGQLQPLEILRMQPIGNYAYNIHFSDGHASGIYPIELLRGLGEQTSGGQHPTA